MTVLLMLVRVLASVTVAPGITALDWSRITPRTVLLEACGQTGDAARSKTRKHENLPILG
jgi:hypothetical protein